MKKLWILTLCMLIPAIMLQAQNKDQEAVASAVRQLNQAMIDSNEKMLDQLSSEKLTYGHSSALLEDKKTFMSSIVDGKFGFSSIDLTDQTITISDDVAIVRHNFSAGTDDKGKEPGKIKLHVMQVWQKQYGKWLLIARQSTKIM
jgi:hypothetical protein